MADVERRWVRYIHLLYANQAPASYLAPKRSLVRLESVILHLVPASSWQKPLAKLVVGSSDGDGKAWASVALYDDDYVEQLGRPHGVGGVGGDGVYDSHKMFRSCGKMVSTSVTTDTLVHHRLEPLSAPLILDRGREVRLKFHLASLPLGWAWLIPAFHLPEPTHPARSHTMVFPKSQIDFPLGPGQAIDHVEVTIAEMEDDAEPARLFTDEEEDRVGVNDREGENVRE